MTLPIHFATLHGGPQPLSLLDRQFAALGNLTTIPCTYSSPDGNAITLTPFDDTPSLHRYTDLAPQFIFLATATNTGPATINVVGAQAHQHGFDEVNLGTQPPGSGWPTPPPPMPLGARPVFTIGGTTPAMAGDIAANAIYVATFAQAINSGAGGFAIAPYGDAFGLAWPAWQGYTPTVSSFNGAYGAVTANGGWLQMGTIVFFVVDITVSIKGGGGGYMTFSLPPPAPILLPMGIGRNETTGAPGIVLVGNPCEYVSMDGSDPIAADGNNIIANAWYSTT